jgi:hypothetical protein
VGGVRGQNGLRERVGGGGSVQPHDMCRARRDNFQRGLRSTGPAVFSARHSAHHTWFVALLPTPQGRQGWLSR